jgi:hypothetical protein
MESGILQRGSGIRDDSDREAIRALMDRGRQLFCERYSDQRTTPEELTSFIRGYLAGRKDVLENSVEMLVARFRSRRSGAAS